MESIKALFDLSKLPSKFFFLFAVVSGFLLFTTDNIRARLHLTDLNQEHGWIVGLVFLISAGLVVINVIIWIYTKITRRLARNKALVNFYLLVKDLDWHEKAVIREFYINSQSSISAPIDDATVSGLLQKGIISINYQLGNSAIMQGTHAAVSLNKHAKEVLTAADIDLPENPSEEDKRRVMENRPRWTDRWNRL